MISALDGERPLFRSLPKNCMEKTSANFSRFYGARGNFVLSDTYPQLTKRRGM